MNLQKTLFMQYIILMMMLIMVNPGMSQVKKEEPISLNGYIDSIPEGQKFIVVNEVRIFLLPSAKIADTKGNTLGINDLKIGSPVMVEGFKKLDGIFAARITLLKKSKTKP